MCEINACLGCVPFSTQIAICAMLNAICHVIRSGRAQTSQKFAHNTNAQFFTFCRRTKHTKKKKYLSQVFTRFVRIFSFGIFKREKFWFYSFRLVVCPFGYFNSNLGPQNTSFDAKKNPYLFEDEELVVPKIEINVELKKKESNNLCVHVVLLHPRSMLFFCCLEKIRTTASAVSFQLRKKLLYACNLTWADLTLRTFAGVCWLAVTGLLYAYEYSFVVYGALYDARGCVYIAPY